MIRTVSGNPAFLDCFAGARVGFTLAAAYSRTAEIAGISSAGLPGMFHYTPPADMEVLYFGKAHCLPVIPENPSGPPSPVILNCAVRDLVTLPVQLIDVGLRVRSHAPHVRFPFEESGSVLEGSGVDAEGLLAAGERYAREMIHTEDASIIAECVPAGTTTANALVRALGFDGVKAFTSSSNDAQVISLKQQVVDDALARHGVPDSPLDAVRMYGDNMQPFVAGLAAKLAETRPVVLAGGTQMLAVYALMKAIYPDARFDNIAVITTRWVVDDPHSDFQQIVNAVDPQMNTFCPEFSMGASSIRNLALYDEGYVKEGVGAGACIAYAFSQGVSPEQLLAQVEARYRDMYGVK